MIRSASIGPLARLLSRVADAIGITMFLLAFTGFIVQIFFRYVMNTPLPWTEEFVMIAFIWTVFWAAAFLVPIRDHVTFDVVYLAVGEPARRVLAIFAMVAGLVAFALLILPTIDYLDFLMRKKSPVLRVPMHWVYGCYLLFVVSFSMKIVARLLRLSGPGWRDAL